MVTVPKANNIWEGVLGNLQLQVTRPSYETWLRGTVGLEYVDEEFVVGTPNTFVAEMLERRMYPLIALALERAVHHRIDVRFEVLSEDRGGGLPAQGGHNTPAEPIAGTDGRGRGNGRAATTSPDRRHSARPTGEDIKINSRYTFDSFIVGKSNELAHAAAQAVSERPALAYNPLFIYSGVGLGKTHLLHAIGHRVKAAGLELVYATTEEFTNDYIKAIREGRTEEFRNRYRSTDVLLLDDIQFIIGKEQTQEGFFHTFNALHMATKQIVITSDRPVTALTLLEDRIHSRLAGGLVVDIQAPDLETRLAILRAKSEIAGSYFPPEVLQFVAERIHQNIRELEGNLNRVAAYAQLVDGPITLDLVKRALADALNPPKARLVSDQAILDAVSAYFSIGVEALIGRRRDQHTALARHVAMYLLRQETNLSLSTIGKVLGSRDHTTVLHACQRISRLFNVDSDLKRDILNIRGALAGH
jgi:chromosomal replication initiator protein